MPKFGTKNALYGYFWARILKNYCHNCYQHPQIYLIAKFCEKEGLNFGQKMPDWGIFGLEFQNYVVMFEICNLKFDCFLNFTSKQKYLNFRPKMRDLGIFDLELAYNIVMSEIGTDNKNA